MRTDTHPVFVDQPLFEWRGTRWCHMWSADLEALHDLAARIGLRREWFQQPPKANWLHYDVTVERRTVALRLGAVETDKYGAVEHVARLRGDLAKAQRILDLRVKLGLDPTGIVSARPVQMNLF